MMQDSIRTTAYQEAILKNAESDFEGKIVVDVGTGSGILAWFAIQAGAKHVYAIEASGAANYASRLFAANGVGDRVTVIKGKVEEVDLPEGVKVRSSEVSSLYITKGSSCYHSNNFSLYQWIFVFVGGCHHFGTYGFHVAT